MRYFMGQRHFHRHKVLDFLTVYDVWPTNTVRYGGAKLKGMYGYTAKFEIFSMILNFRETFKGDMMRRMLGEWCTQGIVYMVMVYIWRSGMFVFSLGIMYEDVV